MQSLGKSEARSVFLRLVEEVAKGSGPVQITDRGEVAAVLIGYSEYQALLIRAGNRQPPRRSPVGTVTILEDLEQASAELAASLRQRLEVRSESL